MANPYSTPFTDPIYKTPPPVHYKDAKIFLGLFFPTEDSFKKLLPAPLRPSEMKLAGLLFGEQPCVETGTFMESGILAQCFYDDPDTGQEEIGVHFPINYVDTDVALVMGREVWGYPRKLAEITMKWKKDTLVAETVRNGHTLMRAECTFTDEGEWIDSGPNINIKMIPSVTGKGHDLAVMTAAHLTYDVKNGRSGDVKLEINGGPNDDFSMVKIESEMIGLYFDCDIIVPQGKIIAKLDD